MMTIQKEVLKEYINSAADAPKLKEFFNSVIVQSKENLVGKIKKVKISQYNMNTLKGELAEKFDNNKKKKDVAA